MPKWLYMWLYMVNFSVTNEPTCSVYKGCRADKWRPHWQPCHANASPHQYRTKEL